jgi:hypothetical protein
VFLRREFGMLGMAATWLTMFGIGVAGLAMWRRRTKS